jgi:short-subunit dehydrogenase
MRLDGAVALVTGASSGIGAATAAALAGAGAKVLLSGQDEARLAEAAGRAGGVPLACDLAAVDGPRRLAEAAHRAGSGAVDILVNNAGIGWAGPVSEITGGKVRELAAVNLTAPIELTRLLVPGMAERGRGAVVFVSSIAGVTGVRGEAVYAATKASLGTFAESLRYEMRGRGVGVSLIIAGVIDTPFFARRGAPYARRRPAPIPSIRVATAIIAALEHDRPVVYVPAWLRLPAWLHGTAPPLFRALATRWG